MAERVVQLLEAVEVDEHERNPVAVAARPLQLELQLADEGLVVEETGELVVTRLVRELGGRPVEVGHDALGHEPVDGGVQPLFGREHVLGLQLGRAGGDEAPEDPPQEQELADDLAWCEAERLALARVLTRLRRQPAAAPHALGPRVDELPRELDDERRHVAQLAEPSEALQRRNLVVDQALLDGCDGELPGRSLDLGGKLLEHGRRFANLHDSMMDRPADAQA